MGSEMCIRDRSYVRGLCYPVDYIVMLEVSTWVLCTLSVNTSKYMEDDVAHVVPAIKKSFLDQVVSRKRPSR